MFTYTMDIWDFVYVQYVCMPLYVTQQIYSDLPRGPVNVWIHTPQKGPEMGGLDPTTEINPAGEGELSNHKQLAHHLTVWVFSFLSLCWEISGALRCWALSIGTLERSVSWPAAGTPPHPLHALPFTGTLHPQCSAAQPGWHHVPEEVAYVAQEHPAACIGWHIPNPSIITRPRRLCCLS